MPDLTTQMYVDGRPENDRDALLGRIRDPRERAALLVAFTPRPGHPGEVEGRFDIVLGA